MKPLRAAEAIKVVASFGKLQPNRVSRLNPVSKAKHPQQLEILSSLGWGLRGSKDQSYKAAHLAGDKVQHARQLELLLAEPHLLGAPCGVLLAELPALLVLDR